MGIACQLEIDYPSPSGWRMCIVKPFISLLARLGGMEPQYIPYGLAYSKMPWAFLCPCGFVFVLSLTIFNEEKATCPNCGKLYRFCNNGKMTWFFLRQVGIKIPTNANK